MLYLLVSEFDNQTNIFPEWLIWKIYMLGKLNRPVQNKEELYSLNEKWDGRRSALPATAVHFKERHTWLSANKP